MTSPSKYRKANENPKSSAIQEVNLNLPLRTLKTYKYWTIFDSAGHFSLDIWVGTKVVSRRAKVHDSSQWSNFLKHVHTRESPTHPQTWKHMVRSIRNTGVTVLSYWDWWIHDHSAMSYRRPLSSSPGPVMKTETCFSVLISFQYHHIQNHM